MFSSFGSFSHCCETEQEKRESELESFTRRLTSMSLQISTEVTWYQDSRTDD